MGPQGQASTDGNLDSTIVAFTRSGRAVHQWDVRGKCDGLTADPWTGTVIATVNEDANSSLYAIHPEARRGSQVQHYAYNEPLPHKGGTDAISVYHGRLLISASAPGTTGAAAPNAAYPAVYTVSLDARTHVATVRPLFGDEAKATVANAGTSAGKTVSLALTDPDSNEIVPWAAPRFRGDFMLTSQGDQEQIYVRDAGTRRQSLSLLSLSQSVDDTAWAASGHGRLYATDNGGDTVDVVTGRVPPRHRVRRRHTVRVQQRSGDLPGTARLPGELSRHAEHVDGPYQCGHDQRRHPAAARNDLYLALSANAAAAPATLG